MLISTIIPAYNAQAVLRRSIDSVLSQGVPRAELIVIDDGSTDDTPKIARAYGSAIRYIRRKNQGVSAVRNLGIKLARGRYIAFLDHDDQWLPGKLKHQIEVLKGDSNIMAVSTGVNYLDEGGKLVRVLNKERRGRVFEDLLDGNFILMSSLVVRRECLRELPGPWFPEGVYYGEDYAFCLKLAAHYDFYASPEVLVNYTLPSDQSFLRKFSEKGMAKAYQALIGTAKRHCGPEGIRKMRSRFHLELAAIHARRGNGRKWMEESLAAFRLNPWGYPNASWHYQNLKIFLKNFRVFGRDS